MFTSNRIIVLDQIGNHQRETGTSGYAPYTETSEARGNVETKAAGDGGGPGTRTGRLPGGSVGPAVPGGARFCRSGVA